MDRLTYSIDLAAGIVEFHYRGNPDFAEWAAVMTSMLADPAFRRGLGFLTNRRSVREAPSTVYIHRVMAFLYDHHKALGATRWATVMSTPASYGMARMAQHLGAQLPFRLEVFTDEAEARRWLAEGRDAHRAPFSGNETDV